MSRSIAVAAAVGLALTATAAREAHAGYCGEEGALETVKDLERYAKRAGKQPELDSICVEEALYVPKLKARMMKACEVILAREHGFWSCIEWAAADGLKTHGGVDIYAAIAAAQPLDPFDQFKSQGGIYVALGDARAVALMREAWATAAGDPRTTKKKHEFAWKKFRNNAITVFEKMGGAAEKDFLAAQLVVTKDRAIVKKMKKAIAAIEKRLGTNP